MSDRLLRARDIAAMLGTTPGVAASILSEQGVLPIDFGAGRGRGRRWLESASLRAMERMHENAQPKDKKNTRKAPFAQSSFGLSNMSVDQILQLTRDPCVQ